MKKSVLLVIFLLPSLAFAADTVDCSSSCSSGEVMVSFADGNTAECQCVKEAAMEPSEPNPELDGVSDGGSY
jgi:hypothetical protein